VQFISDRSKRLRDPANTQKKRTLDTGHCVLPVNHQKVRKKKATEMGKRNYRRAGLAGSNGPEKCSLKRKYGEKVRQSGESIP